eukprot:gene12762-7036_t
MDDDSQCTIDKRKTKSEYDSFSVSKSQKELTKVNSMPVLPNSPLLRTAFQNNTNQKYSPPSPSKKQLTSYISNRKSGLSEEFLELEKLRMELLEAETVVVRSEESSFDEDEDIIKF